MKSIFKNASIGSLAAIVSVFIPVLTFLLILNWFYKVTPFQYLQGFPMLAAPVFGGIGLALGFFSLKLAPSKIGKIGITSNIILIVLSLLYWPLGTLIFGV
ncbi:MAG TPA: hypothetical protein VF941_24310 [Clostridia bacterium]